MYSKKINQVSALQQAWVLSFSFLKRSLLAPINRLLCMCIISCAMIAASLNLFSKSVQASLDHDIANYLGAPLVLRSNTNFSDLDVAYIQRLTNPGPSGYSQTASFTTGVSSASGYQSVTLKGIDQGYPLQGQLMVELNGSAQAAHGANLADNQALVSGRVLDELSLQQGDKIRIGRASFIIAAKLTFEPDRLTHLKHALPTVILTMQGLRNTGVPENNDRGEFRLLLQGDDASLSVLAAHYRQQSSYEVLEPSSGSHPLARISQRAERLLMMVVVLMLLMCGTAAATLADHVASRYAVPIAVLRALGVRRRIVSVALLLQLGSLIAVCSLVGVIMAWALQPLTLSILEPHMSLRIQALSLTDFGLPTVVGLLTVLVFLSPKVLGLNAMPVSSILRGDSYRSSHRIWVFILATLACAGLLWFSSDNSRLTLLLVASVAFTVIASLLLGWLFSKTAAQFHHVFKGPIKVGVRSIARSSGRYSVPLISISIAMMAILLTATLRGSFLDTLQLQMLEVDGNMIFSGLLAEQQDEFKQTLADQGVELKSMHPAVRAQLELINGEPLESALTAESDTREETRSKVRLSWSSQLLSNNELLSGHWPAPNKAQVSVEAEVMADLGLELGDTLSFGIDDETLTAKIVSSRQYKAGGSRMMFWFMFPSGVLDSYEVKMMGGMLLSNELDHAAVLSELAAKFPNMRVTNLETQIAGIRKIMLVLTRLLNILLLILLSGALLMMLASSLVNTKARGRLFTLMRVIGQRRAACLKLSVAEQLCIAVLGCVIGVVGVQLIGSSLFSNLFALPYAVDWTLVAILALSICGVFSFAGYVIAWHGMRSPLRDNLQIVS